MTESADGGDGGGSHGNETTCRVAPSIAASFPVNGRVGQGTTVGQRTTPASGPFSPPRTRRHAASSPIARFGATEGAARRYCRFTSFTCADPTPLQAAGDIP